MANKITHNANYMLCRMDAICIDANALSVYVCVSVFASYRAKAHKKSAWYIHFVSHNIFTRQISPNVNLNKIFMNRLNFVIRFALDNVFQIFVSSLRKRPKMTP